MKRDQLEFFRQRSPTVVQQIIPKPAAFESHEADLLKEGATEHPELKNKIDSKAEAPIVKTGHESDSDYDSDYDSDEMRLSPEQIAMQDRMDEISRIAGENVTFAAAAWAEVRILRAGYHKRTNELESLVARTKEELEKLESELSLLQEQQETSPKSDSKETDTFVDTLITHAVWQRVPVPVAIKEHEKRIESLKPSLRSATEELTILKQAVYYHASFVIQRWYRSLLKESEPERIERKKEEVKNDGSAVIIQRVYRGHQGRARAKLFRHRRRDGAARVVQRICRGYMGRKRAQMITVIRAEEKRAEAAIKIQRFVRHSQHLETIRQQLEAQQAAEEAVLRDGQAIIIQKLVRGHLARKQKRQRRIELKLGPRVRELANKYIARGDLFAFLQAVNRDYELHMAQQAELRRLELENASTFIEEVLAHRDEAVQKRWREWEEQKRKLRSTDKAILMYHNTANKRQGNAGRRNNSSEKRKGNYGHQEKRKPQILRQIHRKKGKPPLQLANMKVESKVIISHESGEARFKTHQASYMPNSLEERQDKKYSEALHKKKKICNQKGRGRFEQKLMASKTRLNVHKEQHARQMLREAEEAAGARSHIPQMIALPARKALMKDPLLKTERGPHSALEVSVLSHHRQRATPDEIARAPYATQLRATEVPRMSAPFDNLMFQACLREHVANLRFGDPKSSFEANLEHFVLAAPATLRIAAEEEALQTAAPLISALKSRGVQTCGQLQDIAARLELEYLVPSEIAKGIRKLLGIAVKQIEHVRPVSVQQKWKHVMETTSEIRNSLELSAEEDAIGNNFIYQSDGLGKCPAHSKEGSENYVLLSARPQSQREMSTGGLPPRVPVRAKTASEKHIPAQKEVSGEENGVSHLVEYPSQDGNLLGHFGNGHQRPETSDTIKYDTESRPGSRAEILTDNHGISEEATELFTQRPVTSGGLFRTSLKPGTEALRTWDWQAPLDLPDELLQDPRPRTASTGDTRDNTSSHPSSGLTDIRPSTQSSIMTRGSRGTRVSFAPDVDILDRPPSQASTFSFISDNLDRPSTQASMSSTASDRTRPPSRASYASTIATVDWNHKNHLDSEENDEGVQEMNVQIWHADTNEMEMGKKDTSSSLSPMSDHKTTLSVQETKSRFISQVNATLRGLKLKDSIHSMLTCLFMLRDPEVLPSELLLDELVLNLSQLPAEAEVARREILHEYYQKADEKAVRYCKILEHAGFHPIRSLAACPLHALGIPESVSEMLQSAFASMVSMEEGENPSQAYDSRLTRNPHSELGNAMHREPLDPVRVERPRHQIGDDNFAKNNKVNALSSSRVRPGLRRDQLIARVLDRGNALARSTRLPVAESSVPDSYDQTFYQWKQGPKAGLNAIVTTLEEAESIQDWHPLPYE